jgi:enoyl-CoA hydratase/carnithine racemase
MSAHPTQPLVTTEVTNNIGWVTFSNPPVNPLNHEVCSGLVAAILGADRRAQALPLSSLHDKKETSGQQ